MISPELGQLLSVARTVLLQDSEWSTMNSIPEAASVRTLPAAGPVDYLEFLRTADGSIFGRISVFDARNIGKMQFYADPVEGVPVQLNREEWFSFGKVNEDPLFIRRDDNSIWGFPDAGVIWWQSDRFERFADDLESFLTCYVFGDRYLSFVQGDNNDQWWRFLRQLGRIV